MSINLYKEFLVEEEKFLKGLERNLKDQINRLNVEELSILKLISGKDPSQYGDPSLTNHELLPDDQPLFNASGKPLRNEVMVTETPVLKVEDQDVVKKEPPIVTEYDTAKDVEDSENNLNVGAAFTTIEDHDPSESVTNSEHIPSCDQMIVGDNDTVNISNSDALKTSESCFSKDISIDDTTDSVPICRSPKIVSCKESRKSDSTNISSELLPNSDNKNSVNDFDAGISIGNPFPTITNVRSLSKEVHEYAGFSTASNSMKKEAVSVTPVTSKPVDPRLSMYKTCSNIHIENKDDVHLSDVAVNVIPLNLDVVCKSYNVKHPDDIDEQNTEEEEEEEEEEEGEEMEQK